MKHTEEYSIFSLRVRPTYDFKQKILSLGSTVEVLQPESFRKEIAEELKNTLKQYTCGR